MRIQNITKKRAGSVATACAVIVLTACGSQAASQRAGTGSVASLPAPAPSSGQPSSGAAAPPSSPAAQGGPAGLTGVTVPDNASPAEQNRVQDAWASCMQAHGDHHWVEKRNGPGVFLTSTDMYPQMVREFPAALKACAALAPHQPWQEMPQYNPNYQRDYAKWINCLNHRGVPVTAVPGGFDYNGTSSLSPAQQRKVTVECEMQAFGEK